MAAPELAVDVEKRFPSGAAVAASFRAAMRPGGILVLFGPSGAGKTTVVRCIAGLERPDRGRLQLGSDVWVDTASRTFVPPQQRRVGYVFQEAALFPHLTARGNIEYGATGEPAARATRTGQLLAALDLEALADRYPGEVSGGQAQRIALARALAASPRLLLLDEPFAALDQPARIAMRRLLRAAIERLETAAILVTHDRNDAMALGDHMAVLADGLVRQIGPVLDVFRRPADLTVARSVGVDSVIPARVARVENGLVELCVGDQTLRAAHAGLESNARDVFVCIRGEDVTLERVAAPLASARNHLAGRIVSVEPDGALERVTLDCGFLLAALITRHAREELALAPGVTVVAAVKATAIHLVPRS